MTDMQNLEDTLRALLTTKLTQTALAGKNVTVERTKDSKIQLPEGMSYDAGIEWLRRRKENDEQPVNINERIKGFAADGLAAFHRVIGRIYGWTQAVPVPGFFGDRNPQMVSVQVSPTETLSLPFGRIAIPNIEGHIDLGLGNGELIIIGAVKGKHLEAIQNIIKLTRESVKTESIYKGQAIKTSMDAELAPEFISLEGINPTDLILPRDVEAALKTSLFTPIVRASDCRKWGIPLKRGILLSGPFGTGKSFTSMVTAMLAKAHGWTFIYLEDIEKLASAVEMARHYAPSVLFAEDLDRVVKGERDIDMDSILNTLDGIDGKSSEVVAVFTTNDVNSINPAMLRPGRLDAVIDVKAPDAEAAERLLRNYARNLASDNCDFAEAAELVAGMVPAAIREVVERSKLAAIAHGHDAIQSDDLSTAALAMRNKTELFTRPQPQGKYTELLEGVDGLLKGVEALKLIDQGHVKYWGSSNCGDPNCPIHGKK